MAGMSLGVFGHVFSNDFHMRTHDLTLILCAHFLGFSMPVVIYRPPTFFGFIYGFFNALTLLCLYLCIDRLLFLPIYVPMDASQFQPPFLVPVPFSE